MVGAANVAVNMEMTSMSKSKARRETYAGVRILEETRQGLKELADLMQEQARAQGIPARISMMDAAQVAVREAIERRKGASEQ